MVATAVVGELGRKREATVEESEASVEETSEAVERDDELEWADDEADSEAGEGSEGADEVVAAEAERVMAWTRLSPAGVDVDLTSRGSCSTTSAPARVSSISSSCAAEEAECVEEEWKEPLCDVDVSETVGEAGSWRSAVDITWGGTEWERCISVVLLMEDERRRGVSVVADCSRPLPASLLNWSCGGSDIEAAIAEK